MVSANNLNILHNICPSKQSANTIQRCGRISRTFKGKTYAIVYDYIYSHGIFYNQFYNKKKVCRLKAYIQCTKVPDYIEKFLNIINKSLNKKQITMNDVKYFDENVELKEVFIKVDDVEKEL